MFISLNGQLRDMYMVLHKHYIIHEKNISWGFITKIGSIPIRPKSSYISSLILEKIFVHFLPCIGENIRSWMYLMALNGPSFFQNVQKWKNINWIHKTQYNILWSNVYLRIGANVWAFYFNHFGQIRSFSHFFYGRPPSQKTAVNMALGTFADSLSLASLEINMYKIYAVQTLYVQTLRYISIVLYCIILQKCIYIYVCII